jgi:predicted double-glycine peptidase
MKKTLILIFYIVCTSCDPLFHDEFIVVNNCDSDIHVTVLFKNGNEQQFDVEVDSEYLFFTDEWVGGISYPMKINNIFEKIIVMKGDTISNRDYGDYNLWEKENVDSSKRACYYTFVKYYLYVNMKDFE